ncbi:hypothetical protein [Porphyrobacter sp. GA68]|uniref:hypothetical protein n=1 Tax=Porphyrobacter sp. GA68 TaxID=2883480 RepID=UPI001D1938E0|nr:hypothetical protein [Porphyrobacter sp. GA68]
MRKRVFIGGAALALASGLAVAQDAPRSILPPGFQSPPSPAPTATATAAPAPAPGGEEPPRRSGEIVQPLPEPTARSTPRPVAPVQIPPDVLQSLPTLQQLEGLSTSELDELLGLKPRSDIPPAARRSTARIGVVGADLGGLPSETLARQPAPLVRAVLQGNGGRYVSRWGHIVMRRALVSRLAAPSGMDPVEFAALRAALLNRMGEFQASRSLVQAVDTADWNGALAGAAVAAYLGTADVLGVCPATNTGRLQSAGSEWNMLSAICSAYAGEATRAQADLERMRRRGDAERIDILLAQRYAATAGVARRAFNVEWNNVGEVTPWRFALANALSEPLPQELAANLPPAYRRMLATMPMLSASERAAAAPLAAEVGILSADAMVDLYSQLYADGEDRNTVPGTAAANLRTAYIAPSPAARLAAIRQIWGEGDATDHGLQVLTAYAAARVTPAEELADDAAPLIASMLTAGLDRNALRWQGVVAEGSRAWALIALASPTASGTVRTGAVDDFLGDDDSTQGRAGAFLVAGLAGLGRLDQGAVSQFSENLRLDFRPHTRWAQLISQAAAADNKGLVTLLAGLGMQGDGWERMTARQLYQIVSALNRVGMSAEARLIAAEAVARA